VLREKRVEGLAPARNDILSSVLGAESSLGKRAQAHRAGAIAARKGSVESSGHNAGSTAFKLIGYARSARYAARDFEGFAGTLAEDRVRPSTRRVAHLERSWMDRRMRSSDFRDLLEMARESHASRSRPKRFDLSRPPRRSSPDLRTRDPDRNVERRESAALVADGDLGRSASRPRQLDRQLGKSTRARAPPIEIGETRGR